MSGQDKNASFVVRIWWEDGNKLPGRERPWRGWVQHARSGEATYVHDLDTLLSFMEQWTGHLAKEESR